MSPRTAIEDAKKAVGAYEVENILIFYILAPSTRLPTHFNPIFRKRDYGKTLGIYTFAESYEATKEPISPSLHLILATDRINPPPPGVSYSVILNEFSNDPPKPLWEPTEPTIVIMDDAEYYPEHILFYRDHPNVSNLIVVANESARNEIMSLESSNNK
ncbi:MAG: hypothetical protein ACTSUE_08085 [Promethearchaeota archaeon]